MQPQTRHPVLDHLEALVGEWETEATHQALPGIAIHGRATFEWLEGRVFLIWRADYDHPDIPDSIAILGCDDTGDQSHSHSHSHSRRNPSGGCSLHYFDQRGVIRLYTLDAAPGVWRYWRDAPGFSQRFTGMISPDGTTIDGVAELCRDGDTWERDLPITYRRVRKHRRCVRDETRHVPNASLDDVAALGLPVCLDTANAADRPPALAPHLLLARTRYTAARLSVIFAPPS